MKLFLTFYFIIIIIYYCVGNINEFSAFEYPPRYYVWSVDHFDEKRLDLPLSAPSMSKTFDTDPPKEKFWLRSPGHQDQMVLNVFNDKSKGYYVDLATNQYRDSSNTYVIEYFNEWRGICIEANPMYIEEIQIYRRCKLISSPVSDEVNQIIRFSAFKKGNGGIVNGEMATNSVEDSRDLLLNTTTLTHILDFAKAPQVIDYLSLDIEGAEYLALKKFHFHKYKFLMITIERPVKQLHFLLVKHGYRFVRLMDGNFGETFYLHKEIENFDFLMSKYHVTDIPTWFDTIHMYLLYPHYKGHSYTTPDNFHELIGINGSSLDN